MEFEWILSLIFFLQGLVPFYKSSKLKNYEKFEFLVENWFKKVVFTCFYTVDACCNTCNWAGFKGCSSTLCGISSTGLCFAMRRANVASAFQKLLAVSSPEIDWARSCPKCLSMWISEIPWACLKASQDGGFDAARATVESATDCRLRLVWCAIWSLPLETPSCFSLSVDVSAHKSQQMWPERANSHRVFSSRPPWTDGASAALAAKTTNYI